MRKLFLFLPVFIAVVARSNEIVTVVLNDGEQVKGKLWLPEKTKSISAIVVFVHGTGPNTFLNHRKLGNNEFDYYGVFGEELIKRGIAFFSYNRRGCDTSSVAPFEKIDRDKFKKYLPATEADDVSTILKTLQKDKRLKKSRILLLGWSEGTIIASMVAENKKNNVSALLLAGYAHERMDSIISWQYSGASSMQNLNPWFDQDGDGKISRKEYESDSSKAVTGRSRILRNTPFGLLDVNKDSVLNKEDFRQLAAFKYKATLDAYEREDDEWIWNNYFKVTSAWMKAHFQLIPNKERLPRLKIPIYIFHGDADANCDVNGVYDLERIFKEQKKNNLHYFIFKEHNHDLNFLNWVMRNEIPEGIEKIFAVAEELAR